MANDFMTLLEQPLRNFKENIYRVDSLTQIGTDVGSFTVSLLENLMSQYEKIPAFLEFKLKLERDIEVIKQIKDHSNFKNKYVAIYQQALVLVISNFESFLNELTVCAFNSYPHMVKWPDKKLSLDLSVFQYSPQTVGDILLRSIKEKYTFQDLQSTNNFFKEYFCIDLSLDNKLKDKIILYQAKRHALIHNLGRVDERFLKQINEIKCVSEYSNGDVLSIKEPNYIDARNSFLIFAGKISRLMNEKKLPF